MSILTYRLRAESRRRAPAWRSSWRSRAESRWLRRPARAGPRRRIRACCIPSPSKTPRCAACARRNDLQRSPPSAPRCSRSASAGCGFGPLVPVARLRRRPTHRREHRAGSRRGERLGARLPRSPAGECVDRHRDRAERARHQPDHRARGPTARLRHPGLRRRPRAEIPSSSAGRRPASTPSSWPKTRTRQCGSSSTRRDGLCSGPVFAKAYFAYATDSAVSCRRAVALDISNSSPKDRAAGEAHVNSEHFAHASVVLSEPLAAVPEIINVEVPDGWSQVSERPADSPDSPDS